MANNKLPETTVRTAKPKAKPYRLTDGGGLYLLINPMVQNGGDWITHSDKNVRPFHWELIQLLL